MGRLGCFGTSFLLIGVGAAAIGLTLAMLTQAEEPVMPACTGSGPAAAFSAADGPVKPYASTDTGVSKWTMRS
jgi:hypothetical protein